MDAASSRRPSSSSTAPDDIAVTTTALPYNHFIPVPALNDIADSYASVMAERPGSCSSSIPFPSQYQARDFYATAPTHQALLQQQQLHSAWAQQQNQVEQIQQFQTQLVQRAASSSSLEQAFPSAYPQVKREASPDDASSFLSSGRRPLSINCAAPNVKREQVSPSHSLVGSPDTENTHTYGDAVASTSKAVAYTGSLSPPLLADPKQGLDVSPPNFALSQAFFDPHLIKHRRRTTAAQLELLEATFARHSKPDVAIRKKLAAEIDMSTRNIQVWFQNRRAKQKKINARVASGVPAQLARSPKRETVYAPQPLHPSQPPAQDLESTLARYSDSPPKNNLSFPPPFINYGENFQPSAQAQIQPQYANYTGVHAHDPNVQQAMPLTQLNSAVAWSNEWRQALSVPSLGKPSISPTDSLSDGIPTTSASRSPDGSGGSRSPSTQRFTQHMGPPRMPQFKSHDSGASSNSSGSKFATMFHPTAHNARTISSSSVPSVVSGFSDEDAFAPITPLTSYPSGRAVQTPFDSSGAFSFASASPVRIETIPQVLLQPFAEAQKPFSADSMLSAGLSEPPTAQIFPGTVPDSFAIQQANAMSMMAAQQSALFPALGTTLIQQDLSLVANAMGDTTFQLRRHSVGIAPTTPQQLAFAAQLAAQQQQLLQNQSYVAPMMDVLPHKFGSNAQVPNSAPLGGSIQRPSSIDIAWLNAQAARNSSRVNQPQPLSIQNTQIARTFPPDMP